MTEVVESFRKKWDELHAADLQQEPAALVDIPEAPEGAEVSEIYRNNPLWLLMS